MSARSVKVHLKGDISDYNRAILAAAAKTRDFAKELDTSNDRMSNLVQTSLALAPALVPIGAAGVPVSAGLTNPLAIAGAAAGVAALAFSGVGEALKATNDYAVEPTTANFEKMQQSLAELGPAGREFVGFLQEIRPELQGLQDAAQAGLFPGVEAGITDLMTRMPQVERIVGSVADGLGTLIAEAGDNLADPRWDEFFTFIETEGRDTLLAFGRSIGNLSEGFANLWMAFDPLTDDFSAGFLQMSRDFATWTDGLENTQGFQEFVDYIQTNGPQVWATLGAVGNAFLQIAEAAAPVGAAALPVIEAIADALAAVTDTPLGPTVVGVLALTSAYGRLAALGGSANVKTLGTLLGGTAIGGGARAAKGLPAASRAYLDYGAALDSTGPKVGKFATTSDRLANSLRGVGKVALPTAALGLMVSGLDEKMGLTNTTTLALAGSLAGPWGTAVGAGIGLAMDFADANVTVGESLDQAAESFSAGNMSIEQRKKALAELRAKMDDYNKSATGNLQNKLTDGAASAEDEAKYRKLAASIRDTQRATRDLVIEDAGLTAATRGASEATKDQLAVTLGIINAHNQQANAALGARGAYRNYQAAIDAATDSLKENGKAIDEDSPAGRANNATLDAVVAGWENLTAAQQENEGGVEKARQRWVDLRVAFGGGREASEALAQSLFEIPTDIEPTVTVDTTDGLNDIREIQAYLRSLRDKTIDITTRYKQIGNPSPGATGSYKTGATMATGGYILGPGTKTSDSIPAWLSNGEYVMKASSVERYGVNMMHDINAGHFASGGLAGATRATDYVRTASAAPSVVSVDVSGLSVGFDKSLRPILRGEVHALIQDQVGYERSTARQDRRR